MPSLREEIFAILKKPIGKGLIKMDFDDFDKFMAEVTNEKVDEIISIIEKRIDEYQRYCEKMANKEDGNLRLTFMLHQGCCMRIKEMLK